MIDAEDYWAPRISLLPILPEHDIAADLLSQAADALLDGQQEVARECLHRADIPVLYDFARKVMREEKDIQRRRKITAVGEKVEKSAERLPSTAIQMAMYNRDGWRCRYCGCRVVFRPALHHIRKLLPGAINWPQKPYIDAGGKFVRHHGAFEALIAVPDHVVPHSAGGDSLLDNLVTSCWPCNFGRMHYSLEECGIMDPRLRPPMVEGHWDGLFRVMDCRPASAISDKSRMAAALRPDTDAIHTYPAGVLSRQDLIEGVKAYGRKNYRRNGWHIVIDTWSDADIDRVIGVRTKSVLGAIQMMVQTGGFKEQAVERPAEISIRLAD